jgi:hypothetical protein
VTGKEKMAARVTSYIDCLEDKATLDSWKQRMMLVGLQADASLWARLAEADPEDKGALGSIAQDAFIAGDGEVKAQKGTDLHTLTEVADSVFLPEVVRLRPDGPDLRLPRGYVPSLDLPAWATEADAADIAAYRRAMVAHRIEVLGIEQRVVIDHLGVTGTFDRLVIHGDNPKPRIFDLKTGRVDYGASKMAMQLALYAMGSLYDGWTGERTPLEGIDQDTGLIMHLPAGEAKATLYEVDLQAGREGLLLAEQVRAWRKRKVGFTAVPDPLEWAVG